MINTRKQQGALFRFVLPFDKMKRALPILGVLGLLASVSAASADELKSLLAKPVSPASIALLAPYSREPPVVARWKAALADASPEVRGVAARAIDTTAVAALLPDVAAALEKEKDPGAAREEIRAILALGDGKSDDAVLAAAARFEGALDGDVLRAFARARGPAALPSYFTKLRNLLLTRDDHRAFFRIASRGGEQTLTGGAAMALGRGDVEVWKLILEISPGDRALAASPILRSALASPDPEIRSETAWYLAERYAGARPSSADAAAVLASLREGEAADVKPVSDAAVRLGPELLKRVLGEKPNEISSVLVALAAPGAGHLGSGFAHGPLAAHLTETERAWLSKRSPEKDSPIAAEPDSFYWSLSDLPRGLGTDFLRVNACSGASSAPYGIAEIAFRPDGRPQHVTVLAGPQHAGCDQILKAAFLLSLAPADLPTSPQKPIHLQTILNTEILSCTDEVTRDPVVVRGIGQLASLVSPPKLVSKTDPIYPNLSGRDRVTGVAILSGTVTPAGCVQNIHVVQSSGVLSIDIASMLALLQWKYSPAMLNREAISYPIAITFTYELYD